MPLPATARNLVRVTCWTCLPPSAWMNRVVSGQEDAKGATAKEIDEQARFWVALIQSQHAIWVYAERLDRRASASLDAYRQKKTPAPFSVVSGEEKVLREPSTVPIQYVGVPLMIAAWVIGGLLLLLVLSQPADNWKVTR